MEVPDARKRDDVAGARRLDGAPSRRIAAE
jgi:hypothetical protein